MDTQLSRAQAGDSDSEPPKSGHNPSSCSAKAGRRQKPRPSVPDLTEVLCQTVRHFFPELPVWLNALPDFRDPDLITYDKQDCELRAFYRLAAKIKQAFPRTPLCLLLDAIYAGQPVFDLCRGNAWRFFVTFKEGSMPERYAEAQQLLKLTSANRRTIQDKEKTQCFQWLDDLPYAEHHLKVIVCRETKNDETTNFVWLTNFRVDYEGVATLANTGGRLRWKIENEGFNIQKNGGFNMEHAYCEHPNAAKNYFLLLQIAHFLFQLMVKGSLFVAFRQQLGTWKNFARRLAESFRNCLLPPDALLKPVGQIRFSSA